MRMKSPLDAQTAPAINIDLNNPEMGRTAISQSSGRGCLALLILVVVVIPLIFAGAIIFITTRATSAVVSVFSTVVPAIPEAISPLSVAATFGGEGTGAGLFTAPNEFAVDGKGYVYVSDRTTGLIQRFDPDGQYLSRWQVDAKAEYGPTCLTADHAGKIYACGNSGLLQFDGATGELLNTFVGDKTKSAVDEFRSGAAALLDGSILVYETNNDQIVKLSSSGKVLFRTDKISSHLSKGNTTFNVQIGVDGLGNSFVLEEITNFVLQYKSDGTFVNRFGGKGDGQDQFQNADAISVDGQSRVYVLDNGSDAIKVFDQDGHFLTSYPLPSPANRLSALGMGFDDAGNLFVLGNDKKLYKLQFAANR